MRAIVFLLLLCKLSFGAPIDNGDEGGADIDPGAVAPALPPCPPGFVSPDSTHRDLPMFKENGAEGKSLQVAPYPCKSTSKPLPGPAPGSIEGSVWNIPIPFCEDEMIPGETIESASGDKELDLPMFNVARYRVKRDFPALKSKSNQTPQQDSSKSEYV